jgi:hypothetical protein
MEYTYILTGHYLSPNHLHARIVCEGMDRCLHPFSMLLMSAIFTSLCQVVGEFLLVFCYLVFFFFFFSFCLFVTSFSGLSHPCFWRK